MGRALIKRFDLSKEPVSLVIEGDAFAVLYPNEDVDKERERDKELKKRRKKLEKRKEARRRSVDRVNIPFDETHINIMRDQFFDLAAKCKSVMIII